ncbi:type IV toxin-antitoxin system AbiEi family antitoxin [Ornithinimicrobium sediminis]|uniref:type IV toxin-antitoxin system AbiEi family antitoxin n=1 Tax=Ornithinimicrobium sediminis TaxID=2904603 RepID=UPI001E3FC660|nr:type IV toxin-antitoxin system AbiEi family antitoxin [Ornithinimicrobium sediminis]MCE0486966.1 hypothetical protein [Ornithinimicrobium sediminis]
MEQGVLQDVQSILAAFGVKSRWQAQRGEAEVDFVATLTRGTSSQKYAVMIKRQPTLASVATVANSWRSLPLLVIGVRISPQSAAAFREAHIQYVDTGGNAYLDFGDVYIEVRGQVQKKINDGQGHSAQTGTNLFSARRAQVICALLTRPTLEQARLQDLADASGVSIGLVHDTLSQLQKAGFIGNSGLRRSGDLLELWAAAYSTGLGPTLALDSFVGDPSPAHVLGTDMWEMPAVSGEAAVSTYLGRQRTLTIYVDQFDPSLAIVNRWRRDPEKHPNIFVRRRFWGGELEIGQHDLKGQQLAPWPIVYADLLASGDPRLAEVAKEWRVAHEA